MLGRRRQSIHGGFGPISPQKSTGGVFGRLGSSHGHRSVSPRASANDLRRASSQQLPSLAETPDSPKLDEQNEKRASHEGANGIKPEEGDAPPAAATPEPAGPSAAAAAVNGADIFDAPPGPPPSQAKGKEPERDAEGFSVPPANMNDPISQAQREAAAEEAEQLFKLNIQSTPVAEEDPEEKEAAMSNVTNALTQMAIPSRKAGTIRGRRDVRNTIYVPASSSPELTNENPFPPSPALPGGGSSSTLSSRPAPVVALASEASTAASDNQSVRSGTSVGTLPPVRHPDMLGPGLNASIIETVAATFEGGEVKHAQISGEIAFAYNFSAGADQPSKILTLDLFFQALSCIETNQTSIRNHPHQQLPFP
jgi:F-BAR domain only protein